MINRDGIWSIVGLGAFCWSTGGAGPKWIRRYVWPILLGVAAWMGGIELAHSLVGVVTTMAVLHLGYGESVSWVKRALVYALCGWCLIPFGVVWWAGIGFMALMLVAHWMSNRISWVTWKWVELLAGAGQGGMVAWTILHR